MIITALKQNEIIVQEDEVLKIFDGNDSKKVYFEEFKSIMIQDTGSQTSKSTFI
jgi:hypothetical protein